MQKSEKDPLVGENYAFWGQEVEIGIDEAGRGPVLGPMVYGAAFWPAKDDDFSKNMKKRYGFQDSKKLSEKQRDEIFEKMNETKFEDIGFFAASLSAEYLSNTMLGDWDKGGKNLNKISHDTAIELIQKIRGIGFKVKRVYLDTVGDPKKYKLIIEHALQDSSIQVTVESKADDTYPVVSAASICAKGKEFSRVVGCGYPGDKITKGWIVDNMDPVFGFPSIVRFSWKTSYQKLIDNGTKAEWHDQVMENDYGVGKCTEFKEQEKRKQERQQLERSELANQGAGQKERRMNVATHRLRITRNFEEF